MHPLTTISSKWFWWVFRQDAFRRESIVWKGRRWCEGLAWGAHWIIELPGEGHKQQAVMMARCHLYIEVKQCRLPGICFELSWLGFFPRSQGGNNFVGRRDALQRLMFQMAWSESHEWGIHFGSGALGRISLCLAGFYRLALKISYSSSHNHGSWKWVPPRRSVSFTIGSFSTSMITWRIIPVSK